MKRKITGFHKDEHNDWVAELDCFHGQHVRHKPPFFNRPWVELDAGRNGMLGSELDCVRCDRLELPAGLVATERTPRFSELTVPAGMLKNHALQTGVWGCIHVLSGTLNYVVQDPVPRILVLDTDTAGVIAPGMPHHLEAENAVSFYIEFFTSRAAAADNEG